MRVFKFAALILMGALILTATQAQARGEQKRDNFVLLIDQSAEMNATYHSQSKNFIAREIAEKFVKNVPTDISVQGAIYMYGIMAAENENKILKVKGWSPYNENEFMSSLKKVDKQMGPSSLSIALREVRRDMEEQKIQGRTAIIIISGGNLTDVGEPTTELMKLKDKFGKKVCIFTILVGKSKRGGEYLKEMVDKSNCGFATSAEAIGKGVAMKQYVENVFFKRDKDEDMDGVQDKEDRCPGTPYGATVDFRGCWVLNNINFDSGKSVIKPQYYELLDEVASVMNANPNVRVTIEGHTDSDGDDAYNMKLSNERATAVMNYLVQAEVDPGRLNSVGFGESQPVADNKTAQGKAQNRRIEFVVK